MTEHLLWSSVSQAVVLEVVCHRYFVLCSLLNRFQVANAASTALFNLKPIREVSFSAQQGSHHEV